MAIYPEPGVALLLLSQISTWLSPVRADAVLMVESEANVLSEEVMLGAVMFGHEQMQVAIAAISELAAEVQASHPGTGKAPLRMKSLSAAVAAAAESGLADAYQVTDKSGAPGQRWRHEIAAKEALSAGDDARWSP